MSDTPPTLADALRSLPVPAPSAEFDARVLAALHRPVPLRHRLWQTAQPLVLGAGGSLAVSLLLLHFTLSTPSADPLPVRVPVQTYAAAPPTALPSVDALLDRPGLCAGSLSAAWNNPTPLDSEAAPEQAPRKPEPRRRAEIGRHATFLC